MLIATAGHVDHGKTTLVRALTGVETDRLPEEKSRGLTIDLGFAYHRTSDSTVLGFVDVPGHEKFVRNMLAGVGAIDVAMLVVAADDGPMPQTVEHLAILRLLKIQNLIVVVTRIDLVDKPQLESLNATVADLLKSSGWQKEVKIFQVNAPDNVGVDALRQCLLDLAEVNTPVDKGNHFRFAIDRAFTVTGTGTVVTGAVVCGQVDVGDELLLLPSAQATRIRSVHADGAGADGGRAGQRLAMNLVGVELDAVRRGNWLVGTDCDHVSDRIHVDLEVLESESRPLRHWTPVHVHSGTTTVSGRVVLSGSRSIAPGESALVELRLSHPMHLLFGDRFVIRDQSAKRTIGGGRVVHPFSLSRRNRQPLLQALSNDEHRAALAEVLDCMPDGFAFDEFRVARNLAIEELTASLGELSGKVIDGYMFSGHSSESTSAAITDSLQRLHLSHPTDIGPDENQLLVESGCHARPRLFASQLSSLLRQGIVIRDGARVRLADFKPELLSEQQALLERLSQILTPQATQPPSLSALAEAMGEDRLVLVEQLEPLVVGGHIARVAANRYFHPLALDALSVVARSLAETGERGTFDARSFRDAAGIGRNVSIDVLEYFDRIGITRRIGDSRSIRH